MVTPHYSSARRYARFITLTALAILLVASSSFATDKQQNTTVLPKKITHAYLLGGHPEKLILYGNNGVRTTFDSQRRFNAYSVFLTNSAEGWKGHVILIGHSILHAPVEVVSMQINGTSISCALRSNDLQEKSHNGVTIRHPLRIEVAVKNIPSAEFNSFDELNAAHARRAIKEHTNHVLIAGVERGDIDKEVLTDEYIESEVPFEIELMHSKLKDTGFYDLWMAR